MGKDFVLKVGQGGGREKKISSEYSAYFEEMDRIYRESDEAYMELRRIVGEMRALMKCVEDSQKPGAKIGMGVIEKMRELSAKKSKLTEKIKACSEKELFLYGKDAYLKQALLKDDLPHANA